MAKVLRILFGNKHFTSSTCGFGFIDSVHVPEVEIDSEDFRIKRLIGLFPGTTIEVEGEEEKAAPEKKEDVALTGHKTDDAPAGAPCGRPVDAGTGAA